MTRNYPSGLLIFGKSNLKVIYGVGNRKIRSISMYTPHLKVHVRYFLKRTVRDLFSFHELFNLKTWCNFNLNTSSLILTSSFYLLPSRFLFFQYQTNENNCKTKYHISDDSIFRLFRR